MMWRLMKYELIRKKNALMIFAALLVAVEAGIIYMYSNKTHESTVWALVIFFFLISVSAIFLIYDNVKILSDDLNKKSGYMLFLTPTSGYSVMGAKVLIGFLELLVVFFILSGFGVVNYNFTDEFWHFTTKFAQLQAHSDFVMFQKEFLSANYIFYGLVSNALGWLSFIITIYLAIILRKTLLSNIKYKGLMSFLVFIALNIAIRLVTESIFNIYLMSSNIGNLGMFSISENGIDSPEHFITLIKNAVHLSNVLNLVIIGLGFWTCGYLLTKKVDL